MTLTVASGGSMNSSNGQRESLASRWLSIASSSGVNPQMTLDQRELARRSDLIAWLALGLLGGLAIVSPIAIGDAIAALAFLCFLAFILAAISLNRAGHITTAGIILVASMNAALFAYMWSSPLGLTMGQLPNYDAFAVSVVIAATVLPRRSAFIVAVINSACIVADYLIRPHNANVIADAALYPSVTVQTISLVVRPIALQFVMALVAFLWVRSTNLAIRRADRAEEVAMLEFRELQRTGTLEEGVRYLQQTLSLWAQGNFTRACARHAARHFGAGAHGSQRIHGAVRPSHGRILLSAAAPDRGKSSDDRPREPGQWATSRLARTQWNTARSCHRHLALLWNLAAVASIVHVSAVATIWANGSAQVHARAHPHQRHRGSRARHHHICPNRPIRPSDAAAAGSAFRRRWRTRTRWRSSGGAGDAGNHWP